MKTSLALLAFVVLLLIAIWPSDSVNLVLTSKNLKPGEEAQIEVLDGATAFKAITASVKQGAADQIVTIKRQQKDQQHWLVVTTTLNGKKFSRTVNIATCIYVTIDMSNGRAIIVEPKRFRDWWGF